MIIGLFGLLVLVVLISGCQSYLNDVRGVDVTGTTLILSNDEQRLLQKIDADGSGKVDDGDFFLFTEAYNAYSQSQIYNASFDYDVYGTGDGDVDYDDLFLLSQYFGNAVYLQQTLTGRSCKLDEDCPLRVDESILVDTLNITLHAVESGGLITLNVNGLIVKIPPREVQRIKGYDVKNMRSRYDGNNPKDSTAEIRVSKAAAVSTSNKLEYFLNVNQKMVLTPEMLPIAREISATLVAVYEDGEIQVLVDGKAYFVQSGGSIVAEGGVIVMNDAQFYDAEHSERGAASLIFSVGTDKEIPYFFSIRIASGFSQRVQDAGISSPLSPDKALLLTANMDKLFQFSEKMLMPEKDFVIYYAHQVYIAPYNSTHLGVYYGDERGKLNLAGWVSGEHTAFPVRIMADGDTNYWAEIGLQYRGLQNLTDVVLEVRDFYDSHNFEYLTSRWNVDGKGNIFALGFTESLEEQDEIRYSSAWEDGGAVTSIGDLREDYHAVRGILVFNPAVGGASNTVKISLPRQLLWGRGNLQVNTCEDSDYTEEAGGTNVYVAGGVKGYDKQGKAYEYKDECISLPTLNIVEGVYPSSTLAAPRSPDSSPALIREWSCVGFGNVFYPSSTEQKCSNGCSQGRCFMDGDFNQDGCVNQLDVFKFKATRNEDPLRLLSYGWLVNQNFGKGDCKGMPVLDGDLNKDGCVNAFDYALLEEIVQPGIHPLYKKDNSHLIQPGYDFDEDGEVDEFDYFVLKILPGSSEERCKVVPTKLFVSLQTEKKEYAVGEEVRLTGLGAFAPKKSLPREESSPTEVLLVPSQRVNVTEDDDPFLGKEDAPVTIIEFSDFECPFCSKFFQDTLPQLKKEYIDTGEVRFVYRDFPLSSIHPFAEKAAEASECADEQGRFWEYHDKLFANQQALDMGSLKNYAAELSLDTERFNACFDAGKYQEEVQHDVLDGKAANAGGVPSFFINGIPLAGAQPFEVFKKIIDEELENAGEEREGMIFPPRFPSEDPAETPEVSNPEEDVQPYGYLVEFAEEPLLVKKQQLEEQLEKDKRRAAKMAGWNPLRYFLLDEEDVSDELEKQRGEIVEEHERVKSILAKRAKPAQGESILLGEYFNTFNGIAVDLPADELQPLVQGGIVRHIYPNMPFWPMIEDSRYAAHIPGYIEDVDEQGNVVQEDVDGNGVVIAIIDTGVDYTHPDLGGCSTEQFLAGGCEKGIGGYDFTSNDPDPIDEVGHGTHVAAIAAGTGAASYGKYKGVAPGAKILAYKIFSPGSSFGGGALEKTFEHLLLSSFEAAMDPNHDGDFSDRADIISMSLGGFETLPVEKAIDRMTREGVMVVASAGNSGESGYFSTAASPGILENVITVGSSTQRAYSKDSGGPDGIAFYSSIGPSYYGTLKPDVVAPGGDVCYDCEPCPYEYGVVSAYSQHVKNEEGLSFFGKKERDALCTLENSYYIKVSGTSMAAPFVAGMVALVKQMHPQWSVEEVKATLRGTAQDIGNDVYHQGLGRVDVAKALAVREPYPIADFAPFDRIFLHEKEISLQGSAYGKHFRKYRLSVAYGRNGEFTEFYSSDSAVYYGLLGTLDLEGVENQQVTIRLDVLDEVPVQEVPVQERSQFPLEKILEKRVSSDYLTFFTGNALWKSGWPRRLGRDLIYKEYAPLVEDVDGDGKPELIVSSPAIPVSRLYVFDSSGKDVPGWPQQLPTPFDGNTPVIADVDGDGEKDIVYLTNNPVLRFDSYPHFLYAWSLNGRQVDEAFPLEYPDGYSAAYPVAVDVDGDGRSEIFVAGQEQIRMYRGDGEIVRGDWEKLDGDKWQLPAIGDVDGDGKPEIVMYEHSKHKLYVFTPTGEVMPGFPVEVGSGEYLMGSTLGLGDLDRDGFLDIVLAHGCGLYAFNRYGESLEGGWGEILDFCGPPNMVLSDLDNNGYLEIIFSGDRSGTSIFNHRGFLIPGNSLRLGGRGLVPMDVDGDGVQEILGTQGESFVVMKLDGERQYFLPPFYFSDTILEDAAGFSSRATSGGAAAVDVDGDGDYELAVVYPFEGGFFSSVSLSTLGGYIFVFEPQHALGAPSWNGFFGNTQNTAAYTLPLKENSVEYSVIENPERESEPIRMELKLQKLIDGNWTNVEAYDSVYQDFPYALLDLEPSTFLVLDKFMKPFVPREPGNYRVYLHVRSVEGYEMLHFKYGVSEKSFEFTVKE